MMMRMRFYKTKKSLTTKNDAYAACLRKLNYRDYSYQELKCFLEEQPELSDEFIADTLLILENNGYINDRRFAHSLYNGWLDNSLKGKYHLINKLHKYKINDDIINDYINTDTDELEINRAIVLIKKYIQSRDLDIYENKAKIFNYLKNQYYMPNIIFKAIEHLINK